MDEELRRLARAADEDDESLLRWLDLARRTGTVHLPDWLPAREFLARARDWMALKQDLDAAGIDWACWPCHRDPVPRSRFRVSAKKWFSSPPQAVVPVPDVPWWEEWLKLALKGKYGSGSTIVVSGEVPGSSSWTLQV